MLSKARLEAAYEKAKKGKIGVNRVLGKDKILCDCRKCKSESEHRPLTVQQHRVLYGTNQHNGRGGKARGESSGKSRSTEQGSSGASRRPSIPCSPARNPRAPLSPAPLNLPDNASVSAGAISASETPFGSREHSAPPSGLVSQLANLHAPDQDVIDLSDDSMDDPVELRPLQRTYQGKLATCQTPPGLQSDVFLPSVCNPNYDRDWMVYIIRTDYSSHYQVPDSASLYDDVLWLDHWQPLEFRSPSPVPSFDEGPVPLYPVCALSRPGSPAILDGESEPEELRHIDPDEDRRFYENALNGDDNLDILAPAPLEFPGAPGPGGLHDDGDERPGNAADAQNSDLDENEPAPLLDDEPGDDSGDSDSEGIDAFEQPTRLRNIYIRTWVDSVFGGVTREQTSRTLASHKFSLDDAAEEGTLADELLECLPTMPLTLRSLERRLGTNVDKHIRIYALCKSCGKRYTMAQINNARFPGCPRVLLNGNRCGYPVWEEKELYGGVKQRVPLKSFPYFPPRIGLERILMRPGMRELVTRHEQGDEHDPPSTQQDWLYATPLNQKFGDISQAWGWNCAAAKLERSWDDEDGVYGDVPVDERLVALANLPLGLSFALNSDGFLTFGFRGYSSNGVFLVVNNLPFYLRHLLENTLLVLIMPGPSEPTSYEFDQMFEPLIDDLIELNKGIYMRVHKLELGRCEQELVHGHLSLARLDYMARRKVCGHAGTRSEKNFCMYCRMKRAYISVPKGFTDLPLRDPLDTLDEKHEWLRQPTAAAKERLRQRTGVTFTEFDRLGGWYGASMCPPDAMHLIHLGITKHIVQEVILGPGLMEPQRGDALEDRPLTRANRFLEDLVFPSFCTRRIPEFSRLSSGAKAEQFRHLEVVLYAVLFEAWRVGDSIPEGLFRRGGSKTLSYRFQQAHAKKLYDMRCLAHQHDGGHRRDKPTLESCASVRSRRVVFTNILTYCRALKILLARCLTRALVSRAQGLLARVATVFTKLNISLTPNYHYAMHLGDSLLKYGSVYQTWTFPFERLNRQLVNINHNNHTLGSLETTMVRGFLKRSEAYGLVTQLQSIPNPKTDDTNTIGVVLKVMRNGPAHELQRGMLNAILAGEAHFRGQERIALATTSRQVNWTHNDHFPFWNMVMDYCGTQLPGVVVYGHGLAPRGGVRLEPRGSTRCFPYVHHGGLRFGNDYQTRGHSSRYGYIERQVPVLIRRIYQCKLELEDGPREILCAVVQRFVEAPRPAVFPWDSIRDELEVQSWEFEGLQDAEVVGVDSFTGVFALGDIELSYGHYWLTFAMKPIEPEPFDG